MAVEEILADDRHYVGGDYYQLDDLSGFKIRASRSRKIPGGQTGGLIVAPERWETQQPQDFVRSVVDDQTVPQPRPRQQNRFVITATFVTAPSWRGSGVITVADTAGFAAGDIVQIMLDSGENFLTQVGGLAGNEMTVGLPLPSSVGALYGDPIENTVLQRAAGGTFTTGFFNDGGVLAILYPSLIPAVPSGPGGIFDTGGTVGIEPGVGPGALALFFDQVSQGYLLALGGGVLPASLPSVAGQLWNNGGEVAIA